MQLIAASLCPGAAHDLSAERLKGMCSSVQVRCVGHFVDPDEAARAYDRAVVEFRGDKAVTNFMLEQLQQKAQQAAPDVSREGAKVHFVAWNNVRSLRWHSC